MLALFAGLAVGLSQDVGVTLRYKTIANGAPVGLEVETYYADGRMDFEYEFNDRGRGPKVSGHYRFSPEGMPLELELKGVDYYKSPIEEHFETVGGKARWKSDSETGDATAGGFYVSQNGCSAEYAMLVRVALRTKGLVKLYPGGEAQVEKLANLNVTQNGATIHVTEYALTGLYFSPVVIWLDDQLRFFATPSSWRGTVREGWEGVNKQLYEIDEKAEALRFSRLATTFNTGQVKRTAFVHVRIFDSERARMLENQTVTVIGKTIAKVGPSDKVKAGKGYRVIDGTGKTLLPGLFDMHTHIGADGGIFNIASGVTSVRDLGNDVATLGRLQANWEKGLQIGPRVFKAGLIDGRGPYQCPTGLYADTLEEALALVNRYADLGYVQIKVYSSLNPKFVPEIIKLAHKRGLRVSGHVPNGMFASQFVEEGADEIQHMNFVMLNFLADKVKDTRTPERFTAVGQFGASIDVGSPEVNDFVKELLDHHTAVDATLATFESMFCARPGTCAPNLKPVYDRLPVQIQRGAFGGGLPVTPETDQLYLDAYANMLRFLKRLWDAGVPILAGTDDLAGLMLHRELEMEVKAGIPALNSLQIATWNAARVLKKEAALGSIAPGKIADLLLVRGNPGKEISDVRRGEWVMKDGKLYSCSALYGSVGIRPSR